MRMAIKGYPGDGSVATTGDNASQEFTETGGILGLGANFHVDFIQNAASIDKAHLSYMRLAGNIQFQRVFPAC